MLAFNRAFDGGTEGIRLRIRKIHKGADSLGDCPYPRKQPVESSQSVTPPSQPTASFSGVTFRA
jgi:hypothetical protein